MILTQDSIEKFLASLRVHGYSEATILAYNSDLKDFLTWKPPYPHSLMSEAEAAAWLTMNRKTKWSPKTTQRKLTSLRRYAKWAGNPAFLSEYRPPTPADPEPHPLPEGIPGVLRLIEVAADDRQRALIALCGLCGLRVAEACGVLAGDVHVSRGVGDRVKRTLVVRGKGDKTRILPISGAAWVGICEAWVAVRATEPILGYSQRYARKLVTNLGRKAKLSREIASHDLRATFATAAYEVSGDIVAVQRLLGHSSVITTQGYLGRSQAQMRDAANVVTGDE